MLSIGVLHQTERSGLSPFLDAFTSSGDVVEMREVEGHSDTIKCFRVSSTAAAAAAQPPKSGRSTTSSNSSSVGSGSTNVPFFVRAVAVQSHIGHIHGVSSKLSFCQGLLIAAESLAFMEQQLCEAFLNFVNSNGCFSRIVVAISPRPAVVRTQLHALEQALSAQLSALGSTPLVFVFSPTEAAAVVVPTDSAPSPYDGSASQPLPSPAPTTTNSGDGSGADRKGGARQLLPLNPDLLRRHARDLNETEPSRKGKPHSSDASPLPRRGAEDKFATRVYVIDKVRREHEWYVAVLGGRLEEGCRIHVRGGHFLTVSHVSPVAVSSDSSPACREEDDGKTTKGSAAAAETKKEKLRIGTRYGCVCAIRFRQRSAGFSWSDLPVDDVAGSGTVSGWEDGWFPKRPLLVHLRLPRVAGSFSSFLKRAVASTSDGGSGNDGEFGLSLDGDCFFTARVVSTSTETEAGAMELVENGEAASHHQHHRDIVTVALEAAEPVSLTAPWLHHTRKLRGRRFNQALQHRSTRLQNLVLPQCAVAARLLLRSSAAGVGEGAEPTTTSPCFEMVEVLGAIGRGLLLNHVALKCTWLTSRTQQRLQSDVLHLLEHQQLPAASCDLLHRSFRRLSSVALPRWCIAQEITATFPPYCDGQNVFQFMTSIAVDHQPPHHGANGAPRDGAGGVVASQSAFAAGGPGFLQAWGRLALAYLLQGTASISVANARKLCSTELLDFVLDHVAPEDIPTEALPTVVPLLIIRLFATVGAETGAARWIFLPRLLRAACKARGGSLVARPDDDTSCAEILAQWKIIVQPPTYYSPRTPPRFSLMCSSWWFACQLMTFFPQVTVKMMKDVSVTPVRERFSQIVNHVPKPAPTVWEGKSAKDTMLILDALLRSAPSELVFRSHILGAIVSFLF